MKYVEEITFIIAHTDEVVLVVVADRFKVSRVSIQLLQLRGRRLFIQYFYTEFNN